MVTDAIVGRQLRRYVKPMAAFTLIEILLALTLIALLLTIAAPRYFSSLERAKEVALQENLKILRRAIDHFYADTGKYPDSLLQLAEKYYIRAVPVDPFTETAESWVTLPPKNTEDRGIADIRSGATGQTKDGRSYADL
ncbi:MAG: prepilin-type N-terminal cleavage/methylation domain-containing protein [Betaproteobacteria bacterium]|nr:prepilin-type N-terminal cleavage/methylation domain-containing protein [Betaproteobacteria bacterium]